MFRSACPDSNIDARVSAHAPAALSALRDLYGERADFEAIADRIIQIARAAAADRSPHLQALDESRRARPDWFQDGATIFYSAYADRFAGSFRDVGARIGHLKQLGVSVLHLLPVLKSRSGANDGGFAISDYRQTDSRYGSIEDLSRLADELRQSGVSLCLDFICNHTADDHPWALKAKAGDEAHRAFYRIFPDRELPDAFERSLGQVFPDTAPGNFTYCDAMKAWVWTTFYPYQWDLNYANPNVFAEMFANLAFLANVGADVIRVDAAPFLWKRLGGPCVNEPEVFAILRAFRALLAISAPACVLLAEAIVPDAMLARYVDSGEIGGGCHLAYNATMMTASWAALQSGDVSEMTNLLASRPPINREASWLNYVRCHDDIGWQVLDPPAGCDRSAFIDRMQAFFAGETARSFARGQRYQASGSNGTTASLCGLEAALEAGDNALVALSVDRILALYTISFAYGGPALIQMGDEWGLLNDAEFSRCSRFDGDLRWLHRGLLRWPATEEGAGAARRLFDALAQLARLRHMLPPRGSVAAVTSAAGGRVIRLAHGENLVVAVNFANEDAIFAAPVEDGWVDHFTGRQLPRGQMILPPYGRLWSASTGSAISLHEDKPT